MLRHMRREYAAELEPRNTVTYALHRPQRRITMQRIVLTLAGAGVLAACGAAGTTTSSNGTGGAVSSGSTIATATTALGTVLTDSRGFTLYYFLPEKNSTVGACTGGCLTEWPPLVTTRTPTASSAVTRTLGTVSVM